jgi:hypothetical protein
MLVALDLTPDLDVRLPVLFLLWLIVVVLCSRRSIEAATLDRAGRLVVLIFARGFDVGG